MYALSGLECVSFNNYSFCSYCGNLPLWYNIAHFSENWGYLSLSPMIAGNLFSVIFGQNLDAHDGSKKLSSVITRSAVVAPQCLQGLDCYVDTIYLTISANFLAILLSVWASFRDRKKIALARRNKQIRRPASAWETTDEI